MRYILLLMTALTTASAFADHGGMHCTAEQFVVAPDGLRNHLKKDLVLEKDGGFYFYTAELDGYAYTVNPNLGPNDFMLTISWGEGWTSGVNMTATFGDSKRMQMSFVDKTKVFKLVCLKD